AADVGQEAEHTDQSAERREPTDRGPGDGKRDGGASRQVTDGCRIMLHWVGHSSILRRLQVAAGWLLPAIEPASTTSMLPESFLGLNGGSASRSGAVPSRTPGA